MSPGKTLQKFVYHICQIFFLFQRLIFNLNLCQVHPLLSREFSSHGSKPLFILKLCKPYTGLPGIFLGRLLLPLIRSLPLEFYSLGLGEYFQHFINALFRYPLLFKDIDAYARGDPTKYMRQPFILFNAFQFYVIIIGEFGRNIF